VNFRRIADLNAAIVRELHRIPTDVDAVVGVPRSGVLAANMVALHLQLPVVELGSITRGIAYTPNGARGVVVRRILLVDDTVRNGTEMKRVIKALRPMLLDVVRLAVYRAPKSPPGAVDIALETVELPRMFEWNIFNHRELGQCDVDLDGVLCRDPSSRENDDGPRYAKFLETVEPRWIPRRRIGRIVSARLEKYRDQTVAWLAAHGVEYGALELWDLPNMQRRRELGLHAEYKADHYAAGSAVLFVESHAGQAAQIAALSRRPVWCPTVAQFYDGAKAA